MVLKLAGDEIREVHRALSVAYSDVLRQLSGEPGYLNPPGLELCRRKWKLESVLRQLDSPDEPPPVLQMVPGSPRRAWLGKAA